MWQNKSATSVFFIFIIRHDYALGNLLRPRLIAPSKVFQSSLSILSTFQHYFWLPVAVHSCYMSESICLYVLRFSSTGSTLSSSYSFIGFSSGSEVNRLLEIYDTYTMSGDPDGSVGIATTYGLVGPGNQSGLSVRFSAPVQTGPGAHSAPYKMGTG